MSARNRAIAAAMAAYRAPSRDGAVVNDMRAAIDAYEAAMREAGFVMVPVEPTLAMCEAVAKRLRQLGIKAGVYDLAHDIVDIALAAALPGDPQ